MTLPLLLFALLIALLCGAVFHILRGGNGWRLLVYLVFSTVGFSIGQALSMWRDWRFLTFGALDLGAGLAGSLIFMILGDWLSRVKSGEENSV